MNAQFAKKRLSLKLTRTNQDGSGTWNQEACCVKIVTIAKKHIMIKCLTYVQSVIRKWVSYDIIQSQSGRSKDNYAENVGIKEIKLGAKNGFTKETPM